MVLARQPALRSHDSRRGESPTRRRTRRNLGIVASGCLVFAAPAGAATLTDASGRTIEVPAQVSSVVPAGPPAQVLLHALVPAKVAGLVETFSDDHAIYVDPDLLRRPKIPMLSRSSAPQDIAAVAAVKPGLVVDYGNTGKRYVAETEKIGSDLGVPAAIFSGDLAQAPKVVHTLGAALGAEDRAGEVEKAIARTLARLDSVADLPDADRTPVYVARGADGLDAMRAGTSFDETLRLAGGRNVVGGTGGTFRRLAVADVVALKPSVVVFGDIGALSSPLRKALPPATTVVLDTGEPYLVVVGPPSINRIIGALALGAILHPDKVAVDPEDVGRLETTLFPIPPGLAVPSPLQVRK